MKLIINQEQPWGIVGYFYISQVINGYSAGLWEVFPDKIHNLLAKYCFSKYFCWTLSKTISSTGLDLNLCCCHFRCMKWSRNSLNIIIIIPTIPSTSTVQHLVWANPFFSIYCTIHQSVYISLMNWLQLLKCLLELVNKYILQDIYPFVWDHWDIICTKRSKSGNWRNNLSTKLVSF